MPVYEYRCTCGRSEERILAVHDRDHQVCGNCLRTMERQLAAPMGKMAGQTAKGGGADRFTADMLGVRPGDLPQALKTPQDQCDS